MRYTRPNGKRNMMSLGPYPEITLAEARDKRTDARRLIAKGIDPVEQRKEGKLEKELAGTQTVRAMAKEWHDTMSHRWTAGSGRDKQSWGALERHVFPYMGSRPLVGIKPLEWLAERMKMGREHKVPLPSQAILELRELHRMTHPFGWLFPGRNNPRQPLSNATFNMAFKRMGYEGRLVPHGLRHMVATGLKESGYPREWIEMQLSHKLPGVEGTHTHTEHMAPEQRPAMMQFWADKLYPMTSETAP